MLKSVTTEIDKPVIVELAVSAMEEVYTMAQAGETLWVPAPNNSTEILNQDQYLTTYSTGIIGPRILGLTSEASRESSIVAFNHLKLVDILMDVVSFLFLLHFFFLFLRNPTYSIVLTILCRISGQAYFVALFQKH